MTTSACHHRRTASAPVLDRAVDALEARRIADVELLVAAAEWAEANPAGPGVEGGVEALDLHREGRNRTVCRKDQCRHAEENGQKFHPRLLPCATSAAQCSRRDGQRLG